MSPPPADPSPADPAALAEARLLDAALATLKAGSAWDGRLVGRAALAAGLPAGEAALLAPLGPRDLAALLWARHDAAMLAGLEALDPAGLKVRERIRAAVRLRIEAAMADRAAVEASARFLARPMEAALALRLGWGTADAIWRWAGDTATDANHYSKRALLWGVLASTLAVRLSRGEAAAERNLDARLADVLAIEKLKGRLPPVMDGLALVVAQLGRLRYEGAPSVRG